MGRSRTGPTLARVASATLVAVLISALLPGCRAVSRLEVFPALVGDKGEVKRGLAPLAQPTVSLTAVASRQGGGGGRIWGLEDSSSEASLHLLWVPGREKAFVERVQGQGPQALYLADFASGKVTPLGVAFRIIPQMPVAGSLYSPDGRYFGFASWDGGQAALFVYDLERRVTVPLVSGAWTDPRLTWIGPAQAVVESPAQGIAVCDLEAPFSRLYPGAHAYYGRVPDGRLLLQDEPESGPIYLWDGQGDRERVTPEGAESNVALVSPSGRYVAALYGRPGAPGGSAGDTRPVLDHLALRDLEAQGAGSTWTVALEGPAKYSLTDIAWSPDSSKLALVQDQRKLVVCDVTQRAIGPSYEASFLSLRGWEGDDAVAVSVPGRGDARPGPGGESGSVVVVGLDGSRLSRLFPTRAALPPGADGPASIIGATPAWTEASSLALAYAGGATGEGFEGFYREGPDRLEVVALSREAGLLAASYVYGATGPSVPAVGWGYVQAVAAEGKRKPHLVLAPMAPRQGQTRLVYVLPAEVRTVYAYYDSGQVHYGTREAIEAELAPALQLSPALRHPGYVAEFFTLNLLGLSRDRGGWDDIAAGPGLCVSGAEGEGLGVYTPIEALSPTGEPAEEATATMVYLYPGWIGGGSPEPPETTYRINLARQWAEGPWLVTAVDLVDSRAVEE